MGTASSSNVTDSDWKYPQKTANKTGLLQVDTNPDHKIHWEEYGNPNGEPVMVLHGGPGGGCSPDMSRYFDPKRYRIILFDQRGCGLSTPNVAVDGPDVALKNNNTDALVEDIDKLRKALGIDGKMHVFGGSWGSTLSLTYAERHPETVQDLTLRGIFLGNKADLEFMYQGNAATYAQDPYQITAPGSYIQYPEAWKQFVEVIPEKDRGDMMKAYKAIFDMKPKNDAEKALQKKAAIAWSVWEGTISHIIPNAAEAEAGFGEANYAVYFAQIEAHFFANHLFLKPNEILDNISNLGKTPVHIVHGRFDDVCPLPQAEALASALTKAGNPPASFAITTAGHSAMEIENAKALTAVMDTLPKMPGFGPKITPAPQKPKGPGR